MEASPTILGSRPSPAIVAAQLKRQERVAAATRQALENTRADLQSLGRWVPSLSTAGDAPISMEPTEDRDTHSPRPVKASLKYHWKVRREEVRPGPHGEVPPYADYAVVGDGGIGLDVFIAEDRSSVFGEFDEVWREYVLPADFAGEAMYLYYFFEANPKSKDLETAVISVLERNTAALQKALWAMDREESDAK